METKGVKNYSFTDWMGMTTFENIPEDLKFYKFDYNSYVIIFEDDNEELKSKFGNLKINTLNNYCIVFIDGEPEQEIQLGTIEEFNTICNDLFGNYYIKIYNRHNKVTDILKILEFKGDKMICASVGFYRYNKENENNNFNRIAVMKYKFSTLFDERYDDGYQTVSDSEKVKIEFDERLEEIINKIYIYD